MKKITIKELAALAINLEPGAILAFNADENDKMTYGIVMINHMDSDVLLANCVGGGYPFAIDVTEYDSELGQLTESLTQYVSDLDAPYTGFVYVDEN